MGQKSGTASLERDQLWLIVQNAREGIVVIQDGIVVFCNPRVCEILGYSEIELQSHGIENFIHPEDREIVLRYHASRSSGQDAPERYEHRLLRKSGESIWVEVSGTLIDWKGKPATMKAFIDISKRKKAEKSFKESSFRYQNLIQTMKYGVEEVDLEGRITFHNDSCSAILGYDPGELVGTYIWDYDPDQDSIDRLKDYFDYIKTEKPTPEPYVSKNVKKTGEVIDVVFDWDYLHDQEGTFTGFISVLTDVTEKKCAVNFLTEDGALQGFVGVTRDITERKQSESRILSSKSKFNSLFENAGEGIFIADGTSTITDANKSAADILGYDSPDQLVGLNAKDLIHPDDLALVSTEDNFSHAKGGGVLRLERRYHRADGSYIPVRVTIKFIGEFGVHHVIFSDISERKKAEQALKKSEERVRRKLKAILDPEEGMAELELSDIIDFEALQSMMDNFYQVTGIGIGVLDMKGNILVATGWQDICTRFHRVHPEAAQACKESDLLLSSGLTSGDFRLYRCRNNMWDIATPLMVGDKHVGNVFLGQFFFDDEEPDREAFRRQAQLYGFDEQEYLDALDRVPRWSRERVDTVMRFYSQFADTLASLSYGNIKLAWAKAEQDKIYYEMRSNQERLSLAVEMANMGHWEMDISTMSFTFNEQFYSLYATTSKQEGGFVMSADDYASNFVHPDEADFVSKEIYKILSDECDDQTAQLEHRIIRRDGMIRHIVVRYVVIKNSTGEIIKTIGVNQDITDRVVAESSLKESEDKFRSAFLSSPDAISINRLSDGLYIDINLGFTSLTGFTHEDIKGKTSKDIDIWCDLKDRKRFVRDLKKHGYCSNLQAEFRRKDNSITTALMSARVITLNGELHTISIAKDIQERITAENLLAAARNEFESIFENSHVGIMFLRGGRVLHRLNQRFAEIFGFDSTEDMAGISMRDLHIDEFHFLEFGKRYYYNLSLGEQTQVEYQLKKMNGEPIWCSLSGKAIDPTDLNKGVIWVVDDLSNRKAMEERLIQAKEAAEEASKIKSEFLANMSHEIRTPMNGVLGMLQLLQTTNINEEQKEYILIAIQSSNRLTRLLSDILDLSRVEVNRLSIQSQPFDLAEVIDQVCELFKPTAQQAHIELICHVDPRIPHTLNGDAVRIQQVLTNVIGNSLKFTQKGHVTVEAYLLAVSFKNICRVLFSISDTGIGIPDDKVKLLFQPFSQVSTGYCRKYQGAGLGLSICKKLVELMGGNIAIESEPNEGTTIHFCVTFSVDDKILRPEDSYRTPGISTGLRILLAEDECVNRLATTKLLETKGYTVKAVKDGQEAVSQLKEGSFDVVLMDVQMPVMDGVEATKAIRRGEAGQDKKNIPIIAVTAYAMVGDREEFFAAGMNGFVSKPANVDEIQREVNEALGTNMIKQ